MKVIAFLAILVVFGLPSGESLQCHTCDKDSTCYAEPIEAPLKKCESIMTEWKELKNDALALTKLEGTIAKLKNDLRDSTGAQEELLPETKEQSDPIFEEIDETLGEMMTKGFMCVKLVDLENPTRVSRSCEINDMIKCDKSKGCFACGHDGCNSSSSVKIGIIVIFISIFLTLGLWR